MRYLLLDASALAKRYVPETGSDRVARIFAAGARVILAALTLGIGEVISVITRRENDRRLAPSDALDALAALDREVLQDKRFLKVPVPDSLLVSSFALIRRHNLNASDAVLLQAALEMRDGLAPGATVVLVAADSRLLRAAQDEGLITIDPEHDTLGRVDALLASEAPPPA